MNKTNKSDQSTKQQLASKPETVPPTETHV